MSGFGDLFGAAGFAGTPLGQAAAAAQRDTKKKPTRGALPPIRGKRIDGVLYVRADDVADALQSQVPTAAARGTR
ncbi:hypothetical protein [Blastococcus sp. CCUG 61487]|uniref:hypothetical protein n=1 Tax=Blastococcus sp. CCUG 61487 TaxID=1840703 RepID=UPI0010BFD096|nr:hypothetical protein [Blastococcus sp. CCUG 61487]TKJ24347.1 hypothetical protein A6V29_04945 [Blastococcus sp. CCUG 61487]